MNEDNQEIKDEKKAPEALLSKAPTGDSIKSEKQEPKSMVYGFKFGNRPGVFTYKSDDKYSINTKLIVKTDRGKELTEVKYIDLNKEIDRKRELEIYSIVRVVNDNDEAIILRNIEKEKSALEIARKKVTALSLQMKISEVEYLFDCSRIIFYFLAPRKVDFRELVRILASEFKSRIELRQITTRQHVGMKGAIGSCGRETCCSSFLTRTPVVSMDMVETQRLSKNPAKLNGVCGKLKCCLSYENNFYEEASKGIPTRGSCVSCKSGKKGKVCGINVFSKELTIYVDEEKSYENISFDDILSEEEAKKRDLAKEKKNTQRNKSKDEKSSQRNKGQKDLKSQGQNTKNQKESSSNQQKSPSQSKNQNKDKNASENKHSQQNKGKQPQKTESLENKDSEAKQKAPQKDQAKVEVNASNQDSPKNQEGEVKKKSRNRNRRNRKKNSANTNDSSNNPASKKE
ncbi:hypothetical protein MJH12_12115 [bacterium]|nr:hypothetical protein [bacterium]